MSALAGLRLKPLTALVKCFDGNAHACADHLKAGRARVAIDGRLLFDELQTQDGSYASRVYVVRREDSRADNGQQADS